MIMPFLIGTVLLITGCAPYWKVTRAQTKRAGRSEFAIPPRWMMLRKGNFAILTRHGPSLESILIMDRALDDDFGSTKLRIQAGMLPHEIGEIVLNSLIATPGISKVTLLKMSVFPIDGYQAARMELRYCVGDIDRKAVSYSLIAGKRFHELRFVAAERHYFDEGIATFEELVRSFQVRE